MPVYPGVPSVSSAASVFQKVLVYQRKSAQISGKKLIFLLVAALLRCEP
jgi:hypothetical protein